MKQLTVISGKGGTGKTSLVAAFAALATKTILVDADVDAADLHLVLQPQTTARHEFIGGKKAAINAELCTGCGQCAEVCRFQAITRDYVVDEIACEGCGVCAAFCPVGAVEFSERVCGEWFMSETRFGPMIHARLGIAQENSGRLVTQVRREAEDFAREHSLELVLIDGPPGIGCPVIAAVTGATAVLVVTEPTPSGIHDLERIVGLTGHFKIPGFVCINKFDLNPDMSGQIAYFCNKKGLMLVGTIPYNPIFTESMIAGQTIIEYENREISDRVRSIWQETRNALKSL